MREDGREWDCLEALWVWFEVLLDWLDASLVLLVAHRGGLEEVWRLVRGVKTT